MDDPLRDKASLGRYELIRPLGRGGMGVVYLARDADLKRMVAIKSVSKIDHPSLVQRLHHEARVLAKLNHPNVIQLHDLIEDGEVLALVLEYVEGATLIQRSRELLPGHDQKIEWLVQICLGLEAAHINGVTHCDLKPENVMVTESGQIKIADFGIARARFNDILTAGGITETGHFSGSYYSLSPEQAMGVQVDHRTDIFSFGILIHLLLLDRHPFGEATNHLAMVDRIVHDPVKVLNDIPAADEPWYELVLQMLEKSPDHRPQNVSEVRTRLNKLISPRQDNRGRERNNEAPLPDSNKRPKAPLVLALIVFAVLLASGLTFKFFSMAETEPQVVMLIEPELEMDKSITQVHQRQISQTIERSLTQALLQIDGVSLSSAANEPSLEADVATIARAAAATSVLQPAATCFQFQCQLSLKKLAANEVGDWVVIGQRTWPVVSDSLTDIYYTTQSETAQLYGSVSQTPDMERPVSESQYRLYLQIFADSGAGTNAKDEQLDQLERLQLNAPDFLPQYELYQKLASRLNQVSGDASYLQRLRRFLTLVPETHANSLVILKQQFELLLRLGELDKARELILALQRQGADRVWVNDLRANLAYQESDYATALEIDRENVRLRPSVLRYYNLAVSHTYANNYVDARQALASALALNPSHLFSQDLSATIALLTGDLDEAVRAYKAIVQLNGNSESFSSLGLALDLQGNHKDAQDNHRRATVLNPNNPNFWLNLADSNLLQGDKAAARNNYKKALELSSDLSDLTDRAVQMQALAHLDQHPAAIRLLRETEQQYDSLLGLNHAAAIVHVLAGNSAAALIEVEEAIDNGTSVVWFRYPWFKPLCEFPLFLELTASGASSVISICQQP